MAFLVFEGLDGSGKSSLMRVLESELSRRRVIYHHTREPGGTPLGEEIRKILLCKGMSNPVPRAELLLYQASRAQHVDEVIKPRLAKGEWVLSDRFSASSVAFQAGGRAISDQDVLTLNQFATAGLTPDLTILLDIPVEESRRRQAHRTAQTGEASDRIESEMDEFHERVRQSFLKQAAQDKKNWLVLDAYQSTEEMLSVLLKALKDRQWLGS
ncbi:MAG: dTMP kinase [Bdellovibrionaceae bacterium]|jgi:dTMP kinase|nr:dTMP kinase [Pseudobdellovibrionaceae bacterium]